MNQRSHIQYTPEQIDQMKRELISWAFQIPEFDSMEAANQAIRSQVHPSVYRLLIQLNTTIQKESPRFFRRVSEYLSADQLQHVHPHIDAIVAAYEESTEAHVREGYREMLYLITVFREQLLNELFGAVHVEKMSDKMHHRFAQDRWGQRTPITTDRFWKEWEAIRKDAAMARPAPQNTAPIFSVDMHPVLVTTAQTGSITHYSVPVQLRLYDPIQSIYDFTIGDPVEQNAFRVDHSVSIPWERAKNGMTLELIFDPRQYPHAAIQRIPLNAKQMEVIRTRGSAIPTRIGLHDEITIYPEYVEEMDIFYNNPLPEETCITVRAARAVVEIKKESPYVQLTIFV